MPRLHPGAIRDIGPRSPHRARRLRWVIRFGLGEGRLLLADLVVHEITPFAEIARSSERIVFVDRGEFIEGRIVEDAGSSPLRAPDGPHRRTEGRYPVVVEPRDGLICGSRSHSANKPVMTSRERSLGVLIRAIWSPGATPRRRATPPSQSAGASRSREPGAEGAGLLDRLARRPFGPASKPRFTGQGKPRGSRRARSGGSEPRSGRSRCARSQRGVSRRSPPISTRRCEPARRCQNPLAVPDRAT